MIADCQRIYKYCFEFNKNKLIDLEKEEKYNYFLEFKATKLMYKEVDIHYKKSGIELKSLRGFKYYLQMLLDHHKSLHI